MELYVRNQKLEKETLETLKAFIRPQLKSMGHFIYLVNDGQLDLKDKTIKHAISILDEIYANVVWERGRILVREMEEIYTENSIQLLEEYLLALQLRRVAQQLTADGFYDSILFVNKSRLAIQTNQEEQIVINDTHWALKDIKVKDHLIERNLFLLKIVREDKNGIPFLRISDLESLDLKPLGKKTQESLIYRMTTKRPSKTIHEREERLSEE